MEQICRKQTVAVSRPVMDVQEEYTLSGDFVLPEYCPDVAVVLKCLITPYIVSRQWSGDQLMLSGTATVRVLYLDEERQCVREAEFSQPVSCTMHADGQPENAMVQITLTPEYANCRATSPRRLEVSGAFLIHASAETAGELELLSACQDDSLYTKTATVRTTAPKTCAERILAINELLDFDSNLPEAEQLLGGECQPSVQECKLLSGKAIVKGQLHIHQLYTDDSRKGSTYVLEYDLPFSQILDVEDVQEGELCTAQVTLLSDTQRLALNSTGQNAALEFTAKLLVQVQVYIEGSAELVTDAFCCRCPAALETQDLQLRALTDVQRQTATVEKDLELPGTDTQEILDIWAQPMALPGRCENGKAILEGRLLICLLVRDADGAVAYYERPEEFRLEYPAQGDTVQPTYTVTGVRYTVAGGHLQLRVQLQMTLTQWEQCCLSVVRDIALQEEQAYPADRAALKLYYAQPGERVFDIARQCHASPASIKAENELREDTLPGKTVLLIPMP